MRNKKIDEATLAILSKVTIEGNVILLTCGQLDRKQYVAVNEVLENIGGKWNKKAKGHVFSADPTDKLEQVLLTGEVVAPKEYGVYFTPEELADYVVRKAGVRSGDRVLEPSAGHGSLAMAVAKVTAVANIHCYELLEDNVKVLADKGLTVKQGNFLTFQPKPLYDQVVMNPPFRVEGQPQADIDHVLHALEFLKPSGKLTAIMAGGVLFRENKKTVAFRELVQANGSIEKLPDGSFQESGTGVNTVLVTMVKS
jgi:predicted RNA methylase